ncbi:anti-sigma F factor antagonist [Clostridium sardiniense]
MNYSKANFRVAYMYLKFEKSDETLIVHLIGELDHHSAEEVRVKIDDRIERDNIRKVILNFSGVTFMDSSGIGVVVGRYKKVLSNGGNICVADVNKSVNRVFELSGLFKIIKKFNTVDEAVRCV